MTTVGIATGAGRGMGLACAQRLSAMVDALLLVDLDEATVRAAADGLSSSPGVDALVEPFVLDVTDRAGLGRLAARVADLGTLRAVAHAAGISPTMADRRPIFGVDLVGTALLAEVLRPLATAGTAMACFASMAPLLGIPDPDPAADAALDEGFPGPDPRRPGAAIEDAGPAAASGRQAEADRGAAGAGIVAGADRAAVGPDQVPSD